MIIEIPEDRLIRHCGGDWGNASATDIGAIVQNFLYGSPVRMEMKKESLGRFLVECLEDTLKSKS